jgi:hypothetical protein
MTVSPTQRYAALTAAALVVVAAAGTSYAVSRGADPTLPSSRPAPSLPTATHPALQSDAENRALAVSLAEQVASRLTVYPGAHEVPARDVPPLRSRTVTTSPSDHTVTRSRFWTVPGTPRGVAEWYARHPPRGFVSDGGPDGVGGESRPDGAWIDDVFLDQHPAMATAPAGAAVTVQTTLLSDGSVGVRATVDGVWRPARPAGSFVSDVRRVTVRTTVTTYAGQRQRVRHHTSTITSPDAVSALVTAYNRLPGWPPFFHSCPMRLAQRRYVIVFHTASGDVSASGPMACFDILTVRRDGRQIGPYLDLASGVLALLPR